MCTRIRMCVQLDAGSGGVLVAIKPVIRGHSKIDNNDLNDKW